MKYQIRTYNNEDYDLVLKLWQISDGIGLGESDKKENIDLFLQRNPGMSFVAFINNLIIGSVLSGHDGRRGYVHHLAVAPEYKKQGVGKALVKRCLESMKEQGILKCHSFMFKSNTTGEAFWKSIDWEYREDMSLISKFII